MKTALILGGTGAMGVYLVDELINQGEYDIYVTSRSERTSFHNNLHYIKGNARDEEFIKSVLTKRWNVIVDFMNYGYDEFKERHPLLLDNTDHYVFLSSARVYSYSDFPIKENHPRLLDVSDDKEFLSTQRYALRKARQEDMLKESGRVNYTIIRPYITYSPERLQLGIYEKEQWLYRILHKKPVVIRKEILNKKTSLSSGKDVSFVISRIMGNKSAFGEAYHIATEETMKWKDILELYIDIIKNRTGIVPMIYLSDNMPLLENCFEGGYNTKYDRLYDRCFDNSKSHIFSEDMKYISMKDGLSDALNNFLEGERKFLSIQQDFEAFSDRMIGIDFSEIIEENLKKEYLEYLKNPLYSETENYSYTLYEGE